MMYFTHYKEYPIFEPAEGGYYYAGNKVVSTEKMTAAEAENKLQSLFKELQEYQSAAYPWHFDTDNKMLFRYSKYIGNGESYVVEKDLGSMEKGYEPYE